MDFTGDARRKYRYFLAGSILLQWEINCKLGTFSDMTLNVYMSVHLFYNGPHDRKSEPCSTYVSRERIFHLSEFFKYFTEIILFYTDSCILDEDHDLILKLSVA